MSVSASDVHASLANVSASTAREPSAPDRDSLAVFDPSHLSPRSTWRDLSDGGCKCGRAREASHHSLLPA